MATPSKEDIVRTLLEEHGRTFAKDAQADLERNTPSPLFKMLVASQLFSARIDSDIAVEATRNLWARGWTTPDSLLDRSDWDSRVAALNDAGYTRYQEKTATFLADLSEDLIDRYQGDLRELRDEAERDPDQERDLLKGFKGIGDVGVNIFFREVQAVWDELYPFADDVTLRSADELGLGSDATDLADLVPKKDFPRLVAALVRVELAHGHDSVIDQAA